MSARRHWHGYIWTGASADLKDESQRRPGPPGAPERQAFIRSSLPPVQTGYWLLRPPAAGRTWTSPDDAVGWLVGNYERHPPYERVAGTAAYVSLDDRKATTRDGLVNGVDAWWQYYTSGMGQVVFAAICCPHTHLADVTCPKPPPS